MAGLFMKIGVLTSSRADFGIYLPLLNKMLVDDAFDVEIIAFGTHLSKYHGYTLTDIEENGFSKILTISSLIANDDENAISSAYGLTLLKFADFWERHTYDIVLCLGDRYEMSAAVQAGIPYNVKFAHFHGGETTLGAIDNVYRHQITLASTIHFTAAEPFSRRVAQILGHRNHIHTVGSLSLDGFEAMALLSEEAFRDRFGIHGDFILVTFHPETVSIARNELYAEQVKQMLTEITRRINVVVTMPNADTMGSMFRKVITEVWNNSNAGTVKLIENFGKKYYFSAMKYASLLLGNTSSGIIEAASFGKYVINIGDRQLGRQQSPNTVNCAFNAPNVITALDELLCKGAYTGPNIYHKAGTVSTVIQLLKSFENEEL